MNIIGMHVCMHVFKCLQDQHLEESLLLRQSSLPTDFGPDPHGDGSLESGPLNKKNMNMREFFEFIS